MQPPAINVNWCIQAKKIISTTSTPTDSPTAPSTQEFAQTNLSNVTEPVQEFKDMAINWSMPDYEAGMDISAALRGINSEYEIQFDSVMKVITPQNNLTALFSQSGVPITDNLQAYLYLVLYDQSPAWVAQTSYLYCLKGQKIYTSSDVANNSYFTLYPLKGSDGPNK